MDSEKSLGQVAYEGYFERCEGRSLISGAPLPNWESQSPAIQDAWEAAAEAVDVIEANVIAAVDQPDSSGNMLIRLDTGQQMLATPEMTARYSPKPGDYVVVQEDGYTYLNPKDVFERKYSPQIPSFPPPNGKAVYSTTGYIPHPATDNPKPDDPDCCGCLLVEIEGGTCILRCNECGAELGRGTDCSGATTDKSEVWESGFLAGVVNYSGVIRQDQKPGVRLSNEAIYEDRAELSDAEKKLNSIIAAFQHFEERLDRCHKYNEANKLMDGKLGPYSPPPLPEQQAVFAAIRSAMARVP